MKFYIEFRGRVSEKKEENYMNENSAEANEKKKKRIELPWIVGVK